MSSFGQDFIEGSGVLILVWQCVAFIMTRASHSVRDVFTGLHVVQQVADFCWDVLDWMSGGMACHCCCEEQLLALGSATAASLTTMIRDGHSVVKKDCNCLYYISTKKHGNIRPCSFPCLFAHVCTMNATLRGKPCSLDNTSNWFVLSS